MQTCLLTLGILLAGQLGGSAQDRYGQTTQPAADAGSASKANPLSTPFATNQQQTASERSIVTQAAENPLRTTTQPALNPREPAQPATGLTKVAKPAELLRSLAKPVGQQGITGTPLSLADAVANARSRAEQTRRVKMYWELSKAVTDYQLAAREQLELQSQHSGLGQTSPAWSAAQQFAAERKRVAESAVRVAQLRLQKELGRNGEINLPLPNDMPHCGAYKPKYERIFKGRTSREAKQLVDLLPLRHQELGQRTDEAVAAREWYIAVSQQRGLQNDATQMLKAYEQLALQRRAFVDTAYAYNANIARYTELAVPQDVGTVRLVAMLIQSPNSGAAWQSGGIRRASAEEAAGQNGNRGVPRTFAEGGRNRALRPATEDPNSNEPTDEHSIVIPSKNP